MRGKLRGQRSGLRARRIIPAHAGQTATPPFALVAHPDHPRTCGANWACSQTQSMRGGSSPHMRGKLVGSQQTYPLHRIIPAHAGQTAAVTPWARLISDHPRTCGANMDDADRRRILEGSSPHMRANARSVSKPRRECGSSPHMRGKLSSERTYLGIRRIIPAHAGQTRRHL